MDVKQALITSAKQTLPNFGLTTDFQGEIEETQLSSANQVNILIGLSGGLKGNIVIGFNKSSALKVVSKMMGGMGVDAFDDITKSALGEVANMIAGTAVAMLQTEAKISFSPPTIIIGERIFLLISRVKSSKLSMKMDDQLFNIAFCIE